MATNGVVARMQLSQAQVRLKSAQCRQPVLYCSSATHGSFRRAAAQPLAPVWLRGSVTQIPKSGVNRSAPSPAPLNSGCSTMLHPSLPLLCGAPLAFRGSIRPALESREASACKRMRNN